MTIRINATEVTYTHIPPVNDKRRQLADDIVASITRNISRRLERDEVYSRQAKPVQS